MRRFRALAAVAILALLGVSLPATAGGNSSKAPRGVVGADGASLVLDGKPYRFTGVNAYQIATLWSVNAGCGTQVNDLDAFFAGLRPDSMVRFWAFQQLGYNTRTRSIDFAGIDRVVAAAERAKQRLVFTLGNQSGVCDDEHWRDKAWYGGGYRSPYDDSG